MIILSKNLKLLEEFVKNLLGDEALKILKTLLSENKDLTEDEISEKTGFAKNITRKNLYLLQEYRLVSYKRIKNRETGWYYYYWRVNTDELPLVLIELKKDILSKLKQKAEKLASGGSSYVCPSCNRKYTFNEAFDREFTCDFCNTELVYVEVNPFAEQLNKVIRRLEEELANEQREIQGS